MISIGLPAYNCADIYWLALEGLRNQTNQDFELLVVDSPPYSIDEKDLKDFNYKYTRNDRRLTLPAKWIQLIDMTDPDSLGFLLQAADDYSSPLRVQNAYDRLQDGAEWFQQQRITCYDIPTGKTMTFDHEGYQHPCAVEMGMSIDVARSIKTKAFDLRRTRGVDSWLFSTASLAKGSPLEVDTYAEGAGLMTMGLNNISSYGDNWDDPKVPFHKCASEINEFVAQSVVDRLEALR